MTSAVPSLVPFDQAMKSPPKSIDWMFPAARALSTTDVSVLVGRGEVSINRTDGASPVLTAGYGSSRLVAWASSQRRVLNSSEGHMPSARYFCWTLMASHVS